MNLNLTYSDTIKFDEGSEKLLPLKVSGMSCKSGYLKNKHFVIPSSELDNIVATLKKGVDGNGAYILKDHGGADIFSGPSIDSLVGRITNAQKAENIVLYEGRIEDSDLANKIRTKLVTSSSVGLRVNDMNCSICGLKYGDGKCMHLLGQEYPDEGLHESAKPYLDKPIAAIIGTNIEAREQSIVLFPAIKGASVGLNFSEETEKLFVDIEHDKQLHLKEIEDKKKLVLEENKVEKIEEKVETFNNNSTSIDSEQTMTDEEFKTLTSENIQLKSTNTKLSEDLSASVSAKSELETKVKNLSDELATHKQIVEKYKKEEELRMKAEIDALVVKLSELRKEKELPAKDYKLTSLEVLNAEFELLTSLPKKSAKGEVKAEEGESKEVALKENVREVIFKKRADGKPLTNMRKW